MLTGVRYWGPSGVTRHNRHLQYTIFFIHQSRAKAFNKGMCFFNKLPIEEGKNKKNWTSRHFLKELSENGCLLWHSYCVTQQILIVLKKQHLNTSNLLSTWKRFISKFQGLFYYYKLIFLTQDYTFIKNGVCCYTHWGNAKPRRHRKWCHNRHMIDWSGVRSSGYRILIKFY